MYLIIEIIISLIVSSVPFIIYFFDKKKDKEKLKYTIISSIILLIGALMKTILIEKFPIGLNQDEASIGYEAYSLANYGIDRNGYSYPLHLFSWGSGQNTLYLYILIPLVKIFGTSNFILRIPMAVIGCITLLVVYHLFKNIFNKKESIIALLIFAIIPWHIMKSRWSLESNIFPDIVFYSIVFLYFGMMKKKKSYFIVSSVLLGISTYSYGTSYLFVPIYSIIMYIYLIRKKIINIKDAILYLCITGIVSFPMIIFVVINYFNLDTVTIFKFTIPRLVCNRFTSITAVNGNFINNIATNSLHSMIIFLAQADEGIINYTPISGILYKFSLPFMVFGIIGSIKNKNIFMKINHIFFISGLSVALFTFPNINRLNILWISVIIYIINGILYTYKLKEIVGKFAIGLYLFAFVIFVFNYFGSYQYNNIKNTTFYGLEDAIKYVNKLDYKNLYITSNINEPYIYYLYYNKINPYYYIENRIIPVPIAMFQQVTSIDNVIFYVPIKLEKGNVYIVDNELLYLYNLDEFNKKSFYNYSVIY